MYELFFGLRERPFELTPNPKYLYLTVRHREALSNLKYGIVGRKGITVLIGEAGTGKTTLVRAAVDALSGPAVACIYVSNPVLTREEFCEYLAPRFGLSAKAAESKARFLSELEPVLISRRRSGGTTALIVDEAQSLPHELMEEVRLLANFETAEDKLLQVVLAGQPELAERLEHEELRQLKQRVALRCDLSPLDVRETAAYVAGRIAIAGGHATRIFTREAIQAVHEYSRGIPRTIGVICDNAMITAFATGTAPIGAALVLDVCRDFRLTGAPAEKAPPEALAKPHAVPTAAGQAVQEKASRSTGASLAARVSARGTAARSGSDERRPPASGLLKPVAATSSEEAAPAVGETNAGTESLFGMFTKKKRFRFF